MGKRALALRIASKQNGIVREINDIHIFANQSLPLLEEAKQPFAESQHKKDRRYYVPSIKRTKFAKRTDRELKEIYERFTGHALYETFLVSVVSKFEAFLADVIKEILVDYPQKLGVSTPGIKPLKERSNSPSQETSCLRRNRHPNSLVAQRCQGTTSARQLQFIQSRWMESIWDLDFHVGRAHPKTTIVNRSLAPAK